MEQTGIKRLYYSISEVSNLVDEEQYVLRYWETEFEQLRPQKNRAGNRIYNDKDIQIIRTIQQLLRIKRFTIDGAKDHLKTIQFDKNPGEERSFNSEILSESVLNDLPRSGSIESETEVIDTEYAKHHFDDALPAVHQYPNQDAPNSEGSESDVPERRAEVLITRNVSEENTSVANVLEEVLHLANGDGYAFSRTMQAEWHEPLDTTALLSITAIPADITPTELPPASEQLASEQPVSEQLVSEQVSPSEPTFGGVLPAQSQNSSTSLETKHHAAFSREELLSLRDTLHSILRLIEPPQNDESLPPGDTAKTTI